MKDRVGTFTLTAAYEKLLRRASVGWQDCETGAPEIDPKRPYGNSDVAGDVAEILGIRPKSACYKCGAACENCSEGGTFSRQERDDLLAIHRGTEYALQIVLQHGYRLGRYQRSGYREWWFVGEVGE